MFLPEWIRQKCVRVATKDWIKILKLRSYFITCSLWYILRGHRWIFNASNVPIARFARPHSLRCAPSKTCLKLKLWDAYRPVMPARKNLIMRRVNEECLSCKTVDPSLSLNAHLVSPLWTSGVSFSDSKKLAFWIGKTGWSSSRPLILLCLIFVHDPPHLTLWNYPHVERFLNLLALDLDQNFGSYIFLEPKLAFVYKYYLPDVAKSILNNQS